MMLGSVMKRGSFRRRSVVITAGSFMARVSRPPSISRVMVAVSPPICTLEAKLAWAQPISAPNIWPVWPASSSIACLPKMAN
ncbi:hypothetical protein Y695_01553 [Hydrogenophaga sp. T4]|nr:hypothetical protein Y695_01553 [Hydrogenophaga sp. T4]